MLIKRRMWKNNLKFVKNVPILHVNFIIKVIVVSGGGRVGGGELEPFLWYRPS